jgi:hypothetical protein
VPPIAIAAPASGTRAPVAAAATTTSNAAVMTTSQTKDWPSEPDGIVAPRSATSPSDARSTTAATTAPATWAAT